MIDFPQKLRLIIQELQMPWIIHRPSQALLRIKEQCRLNLPHEELLRTAWGGEIWCCPTKDIGKGIRYQGIFDIVLSEALVRLLHPGSIFVDAGANVGYMTALGSKVLGKDGKIFTFEPNPDVIPFLSRNLKLVTQSPLCPTIQVIETGLGSSIGQATLFAPQNYSNNDGIARLIPFQSDDISLCEISITTLDNVLGIQEVHVLKIDVEGYEYEVLKGGSNLIKNRKITHIIFEEHNISNSPIPNYLTEYGYNLFKLGFNSSGLTIASLDNGSDVNFHGAPSYLATLLTPSEISRILCRPGWICLQKI